ncbi:MAG TPA: glycosyltransferase family 2 protein [Dehalococcoidia bacterium]|nr:glycosyltransferase family 2 protein [Dehalococcoidia bacterium]
MQEEDSPYVSIGLPVYNGERYLAETIESVLRQTFLSFELIICDNASTDGTRAIVERFAGRDGRVRYYRNEENLGAPRNYNRCFALARGKYFKWIAADDLIDPDYLDYTVEALDATPSAVLAYTRGVGIDEEGRLLKRSKHPVPLHEQGSALSRFVRFRERSGFSAWPMLYIFGLMRSDVLRQTRLHGTYVNSDNCLIYEMLLRGAFVEVPEPLSAFRIHEGSSSAYAKTPQLRQRFFNPQSGLLSGLVGHRRLYFEYLLAIGRAPISPLQKLRVAFFNMTWALRRSEDREAEADSQLLPLAAPSAGRG